MADIGFRIRRRIAEVRFGEEDVARTMMVEYARNLGVRIGQDCRIYTMSFSTEPYLISIGNRVTVTHGVEFVTHDGGVWVLREKDPTLELFGTVTIGNNVFIGLKSIILLNTVIGDNCIVAAGSVVKGTFDAGSVIAGVPARKIMSIEEYYSRHRDSFYPTKGMEPDEKKKFLLQHLSTEK